MSVNIEGIDKVKLLHALWTNMHIAQGALIASIISSDKTHIIFDIDKASSAVLGYIDYFQGRCIKSDLSGNEVDPFLYDRDAGEGAFKRIVDELRIS